jgi:hypothetical protein
MTRIQLNSKAGRKVVGLLTELNKRAPVDGEMTDHEVDHAELLGMCRAALLSEDGWSQKDVHALCDRITAALTRQPSERVPACSWCTAPATCFASDNDDAWYSCDAHCKHDQVTGDCVPKSEWAEGEHPATDALHHVPARQPSEGVGEPWCWLVRSGATLRTSLGAAFNEEDANRLLALADTEDARKSLGRSRLVPLFTAASPVAVTEAPLPITAVQVRAALALAESQPASTDATDLSISRAHLLRWIESGHRYPRPAREAPCVHQFTASAAGAQPSEYIPRLEDSVCAKCGVPFQSSTRTDDRRENDRHPPRPL